MKKKPRVWLARDWVGELYVVGIGKEPRKHTGGPLHGHFTVDAPGGMSPHLDICPKHFEAIAPKSVHLKPGEGPIEITLDIKRVKK